MKPLSIIVTMVAGVLVVVIGWMLGPGAAWWLEHVDGVTGLQGEKLAAAVDMVRGRALAVATGLAALLAVYYTARNADTARRTFQLGERGHDTDRYGKAAEQLGHDKAPVRLAGLYALEQLAQNNPSLRQRIVDLISAYLRMPYSPPRDDDQNDAWSAVPRAALGGRRDETGGRDPHEERQVRLTAQRVLSAHLRRPPSEKRRRWQPDPPLPNDFWPGIRIDLSGALLIDLDLRECQIHAARFNHVVFAGDTHFDQAIFAGDADFSGAAFAGEAGFRSTTFTDDAEFDGSTFVGDADFSGAKFTDTVGFHGVTFTRTADFGGASFASGVWFNRAVFTGDAKFGGASCDEEKIDCDGATFAGSAWFGGLIRDTEVSLQDAVVTPEAMRCVNAWPLGWGVEPHQQGGGMLRRQAVSEERQQHELRVQQWAQNIRVKRRMFSRFR
ncbi:pentapeptide repeat-containing protein [Nonomuraea sp. NBC_00507]|uniref:pentapeptide repeat-containing protein n=1 Tax=Nonomuraea sp. NBC_00507 TaxID=2976002 RepID=UPI002E19DAF8